MNTNTRKTNIFITIGAITLLVHAIGFLLPWCNMNGVCRALSVGASIAAFVTEIVIISDIKIGMASFGVGIYICIITLAVNIICCTAVCVLSIKDGTVQKA